MKSFKYTLFSLAFAAATGALTSCSDYLSVEGKVGGNNLTEEMVFHSRDYTNQWLADTYRRLLDCNSDIQSKDYVMSMFDDCYGYGDRSLEYRTLRYAEYDEDWKQDSWDQSYNGIRSASIMITSPYLDENTELTASEIVDYRGQARFARAYLYWKLLQKYGPIPIIPEDGGMDFDLSYEQLSFPRSTYDECVDYIVEQFEMAAQELPLTRDARNLARPTRGAALAARAKVLLYAASPINNPGGPSDGDPSETFTDMVDDEGRMLMGQTYDESKWARAAAAAKDVIDLAQYSLHTEPFRESGTDAVPATVVPPYREGYSDRTFANGGWSDIDPMRSYAVLFNGDLLLVDNDEMIFTLAQNEELSQDISRHHMPVEADGYNCHFMTGKMCDAYEMNDGTPFDENAAVNTEFVTAAEMEAGEYPEFGQYGGSCSTNKGTGVCKRYANREPRFYASCAFNGAFYAFNSATNTSFSKNQQVFLYRGTSSGYQGNTDRWVRTGIGVMKYVSQDDVFHGNASGSVKPKYVVGIRYADVLLWYAEALNELSTTYEIPSWDGSTTHTVSRDITEISGAIRPIRTRAGLPDYDSSVYGSTDDLRDHIRHERMVEFFAENSRYYDVRRWKIASEEESQLIYGCDPMMDEANRDLFHERTILYDIPTTFSRKMYFWPIQRVELQRNIRLTQNPGWRTYQ